MVEWYHSVYDKARRIEGASQRVQEDTIKFSRIMESLGTSLIESILVLVEFFPLLMGLSVGIPILWFGDWSYGLVSGAFLWAVGGTILMIVFRSTSSLLFCNLSMPPIPKAKGIKQQEKRMKNKDFVL